MLFRKLFQQRKDSLEKSKSTPGDMSTLEEELNRSIISELDAVCTTV